MQVFNNAPAFTVWRSYSQNVSGLRRSMGKLSSGLRIQTAADDPGGLAMSERFRSQYRNAEAAAGNVENKISYIQTADSWLQKVHDIMGRMSELAISANDGTKSSVDRENLQEEFGQLQSEVQRITSGATAAGKFNGLYLFRGGSGVATSTGDGVETGFGSVRLQVGTDGGSTFDEIAINLTTTNFEVIGSYNAYSYGSINLTLLGSTPSTVKWGSLISGSNLSISIQSFASDAVSRIAVGIDHISAIRSSLGGEQVRMEQTLSGLRNYEDNIRASESRIRDVDVAKETSEFTKFQILTQIGTAMLAQANALPGGVTQLVG